jgi:DNA-binding transcriptional LysR family regulator
MHSILYRGDADMDHPGPGDERRVPDWESLRVMLEVVRRGSFRAAGDALNTTANTVRRRIDELESEIGLKLVTRHINGVTLTADGERIRAIIENMERASFGIPRAREIAQPAIAGEVKLAATEAFGTFWIVPRLAEFQRAYPKLVVDLQCAMHPADVLRLDAQAAIQVTKPTSPDLKVVKLGRVHSMPSAAPSYLATYGTPKSFEDLQNHRLALQFAEQVPTQELYDKLWPGVPQTGFVAFRTNNSSALLWALVKGVGIGWAPTYIHAMQPRIVPVDIDRVFSFDLWLTYHPDAARIPKVRLLIDWVIESFNPKKFPWFRDEFIHPRDLPKLYKGPPLVNLFEALSAG